MTNCQILFPKNHGGIKGMRKYFLWIVYFFLFFAHGIYAQNVQELEYEYNELYKDLFNFGPKPYVPYYSNGDLYRRNTNIGWYIDEEGYSLSGGISFAIYDGGYMKFKKPNGDIVYSRWIILWKKENGWFRLSDECMSDIQSIEVTNGLLFDAITYFPAEGAKVTRINEYDLMISDVEIQLGNIIPGKINLSDISPTYVISRMLEIINRLSIMAPDPERLYEFKKAILSKMLDIEIQGSREAIKKYYFEKGKEDEKITRNDFWRFYDYYWQIYRLCDFIALD
jgi:hypothetical protein